MYYKGFPSRRTENSRLVVAQRVWTVSWFGHFLSLSL